MSSITLSRREDEALVLFTKGQEEKAVFVIVEQIGTSQIKLRVDADKDVIVLREELWESGDYEQ